jgi:hypothetical protein
MLHARHVDQYVRHFALRVAASRRNSLRRRQINRQMTYALGHVTAPRQHQHLGSFTDKLQGDVASDSAGSPGQDDALLCERHLRILLR